MGTTAFLILLFFALVSCSHSANKTVPSQEKRTTNVGTYLDEETVLQEGRQVASRERKSWISAAQAIAAVTAYNKKTHKSLDPLVPIICEQVRLWRIIDEHTGIEYAIDKYSGIVLMERKLPLINGAVPSSSSITISKKDAIAIARNDFSELLSSYGNSSDYVNEYVPFACELKASWRVVFEYRQQPSQKLTELPNTNPPLYLIDKQSGRIIEREPPLKP